MIHITAPAVAIIAVVGYLGIDAIVHFVGNLFDRDTDKRDKKDRS